MNKKQELQQAMDEKFLNPQRFCEEIEGIVQEEKINYIDAILLYCERESIEDLTSISKLMSNTKCKPLKEKLKEDATRLNFMKIKNQRKGGSLPKVVSSF
tara:strand:- start:218 stop:517 length:300 start_codon:yes stop_codon:yes gene_type:complete